MGQTPPEEGRVLTANTQVYPFPSVLVLWGQIPLQEGRVLTASTQNRSNIARHGNKEPPDREGQAWRATRRGRGKRWTKEPPDREGHIAIKSHPIGKGKVSKKKEPPDREGQAWRASRRGRGKHQIKEPPDREGQAWRATRRGRGRHQIKEPPDRERQVSVYISNKDTTKTEG